MPESRTESRRKSSNTHGLLCLTAAGLLALALSACNVPVGGGDDPGGDPGPGSPDPTTGRVENDSCAAPKTVGEGTAGFSTADATTDGPDEPGMCSRFDYTHIESDAWFCYVAECSGTVLISLCGSSYDSKMAVYSGCNCPSAQPIACSDDDCGFATDSRVTLNALAGQQFLVRVGGFEGAQGEGVLTIKCGDEFTCGDTRTGDCFGETTSPYCDDAACCQTVCDRDWYCCDVEWDEPCAAQAHGFCSHSFEACSLAAGDCLLNRGSPGCNDVECCQLVCEAEPFCCLNEWDQSCADIAKQRCAEGPEDPPGEGDPGLSPDPDTTGNGP